MDTLDRILTTWEIDPTGISTRARAMPIEVPNVCREDLASIFATLGFTVGAEVGVEMGNYAQVLVDLNPALHLYCIDAWLAYRGYREHVTQSKLDEMFASTQQRLDGKHVSFVRKLSVDAAKDFADGSLDFVYLDGNHDLRYVIADLDAWIPKVKHGGIVSGHDYLRRHKPNSYQVHVVEALTAWTDAYAVYPWFVVGRRDVREGERRDRPRSWMWVRP